MTVETRLEPLSILVATATVYHRMRFVRAVQTDNKYCHRLATIIDKQTRVSNDVTVCSGRRQHQRSVSHATADSATVEVRLYSPSTAPPQTADGDSFGTASLPHSLLKYEGRSFSPSVSSDQAVLSSFSIIMRQSQR